METDSLTIAGQTSVFQTAQLSETGGRPNNEDFCGFVQVDQALCWAVGDGLGSHNAGELASKTAVEVGLDSFRRNPELSAAAIENHIAAAQDAIIKLQQGDPALAGMRTTLVMLISDSRQVLWAHVGDSRLYRFQARGLVFQTEDHSVPQSLVKAGEIAAGQIRGHPDRNRLLRCLGDTGAARPTVVAEPSLLAQSDAFLLCTDGFWEYVLEIEMLADLVASESPQEWLERAAVRIRQRAPGEHDNYSAVAIFYLPDATQSALLTDSRVHRFWRRNRSLHSERSGQSRQAI